MYKRPFKLKQPLINFSYDISRLLHLLFIWSLQFILFGWIKVGPIQLPTTKIANSLPLAQVDPGDQVQSNSK
jgi:hypothetical protein